MSIHTATPTQYRLTLHVPCQFNDGRPLDATVVGVIEAHLLTAHGAFTRVASEGQWRAPDGTVYIDKLTMYHIDTASEQDCHSLREYAAHIRDSLEQECVYVTRQQITTWLV